MSALKRLLALREGRELPPPHILAREHQPPIQSSDDEDDEAELEEVDPEEAQEASPALPASNPRLPSSPSKSSAGKRRTEKRSGGGGGKRSGNQSRRGPQQPKADLDRFWEEEEGKLDSPPVPGSAAAAAAGSASGAALPVSALGHPLLQTKPKMFDANAELRRKFGPDALDLNAGGGGAAAGAGAAHTRNNRRPGLPGIPGSDRRRWWSTRLLEGGWNRWFLGTPNPNWPPPGGASIMGVALRPVVPAGAEAGSEELCCRHSCLGRYLGNTNNPGSGGAAAATANGAPAGPAARWYRVEFSRPYQLLEAQYEQAVATYDPNAIAQFAAFNPYHIRSQLQMSYLLEAQGDFAEALDFVQRAVCSFARGWDSDFLAALHGGTLRLVGAESLDALARQPEPPQHQQQQQQLLKRAGCARLSLEHSGAGQLVHALFRLAQMLGRKGCVRTSLELFKLLARLDPADEMCAVLQVDYYAVRAREALWLWRLVATSAAFPMPPGHPACGRPSWPAVWLLPNFSYSLALALHRDLSVGSQEQSEVADLPTPEVLPAGAKPGGQAPPSPGLLLQRAMLLFPEALEQLLEQASASEAKNARWKSVLGVLRPLHRDYGQLPGLQKLSEVYSRRAAALWDGPSLLWALEQAQLLAQKIASSALTGAHLASFGRLRSQVYGPGAPALPEQLRELQRSHYTDSIPDLQRELHGQQAARHHQQREEELQRHMAAVAAQPGGALVEFLRSMLPWAELVPRGGGGPEGDEDGFPPED